MTNHLQSSLGLTAPALAQESTISERKTTADSLLQQGLELYNRSYFREALDVWSTALIMYQSIEDRQGEADILNRIGSAHTALGDTNQAVIYYEQSLPLFRIIKDAQGEASVLVNLGNTYLLSDPHKAIRSYEQALPLFRAIENQYGEASTLMNLGIAYYNLSNPSQAIIYYEQALPLFSTIEHYRGQAKLLANLGLAHYFLGDDHQAIYYYDQALPLFSSIDNRRGEANILNYLGLAYLSLEDASQAVGYFERARPLFRMIQDGREDADTLMNLGSTYRLLSANSFFGYEYISYYEQALSLFRESQNQRGEANALSNLGLVHGASGNSVSQAIHYYEMALAIFKAIGDRNGEGALLSTLGNLYAAQDQPDLAITFYKASIQVREDIRADLQPLPQHLQQSYADSVADTYRNLADLLLARDEILEAQQVLELLKVQELREFTRGRVTDIATRNYELTSTEASVISAHTSLVDFGLKRSHCVASADCPAVNLEDLDTQYDALAIEYTTAVDRLEAEMQAEEQSRAARAQSQIDQAREGLHPDKFQGTAGEIVEENPGTVLIYPVVLDNKLWILWGSAGGVANPIEVPVGRQEIGEAIVQFRNLMTACETLRCDKQDIPAVQAVTQELYRYLIPPQLENELNALQATLSDGQVPNLVFVPDLVTRYIPFAALHDGNQYLIENYTVSTLLGAEQTESDNPLPFADEVSVLGLGLSNAVPDHGFSYPLSNVPAELDAIIQQAPAETGIYQGERLLNDAFDKTAFRKSRQHQILHIATHGVFDPKANNLSYLMLGIGDPIYINELESATDYFRNLSLVVLSACETALADVDQNGLELASIANTFLNARVDTVMASLWQVNDRATSDLMQSFYAALARSTPAQRISVSQALREAQLQLLYDGATHDNQTSRANIQVEGAPRHTNGGATTAHPYYWSPFVIIGNGL